MNGANQTGLAITINPLAGTYALGDIVTFTSVNSVNRITKVSTQTPAQFVLTAAVANGGTTLNIYPALIPFAAGGVQVQYQTVDASPANAADVIPATLANSVYRKNFAFVPEAITMATADLELPRGVHEAARESFDGISMRMISAYNIMTDQFITRLDVLWGSANRAPGVDGCCPGRSLASSTRLLRRWAGAIWRGGAGKWASLLLRSPSCQPSAHSAELGV